MPLLSLYLLGHKQGKQYFWPKFVLNTIEFGQTFKVLLPIGEVWVVLLFGVTLG